MMDVLASPELIVHFWGYDYRRHQSARIPFRHLRCALCGNSLIDVEQQCDSISSAIRIGSN
jgi:hypothetical protein